VQNIAGKFAYMSPEQATGGTLSPQSDVYSLGVILFELLLGKRLFSGVTEFECLRLVREGKIPRPRELDPSVSRELEALLMKALAADPRQRWSSAAAFAAAMRDYRYQSTSAGDPAREIASLLKRYFTPDKAPPRQDQSRIVRIETLAGFTDEAPATLNARGAQLPTGARAPAPGGVDSDATRADPELVAALAAAEASGAGPSTVPAMPAVGKAGKRPPKLASVDSAPEDAETRLIETRRPPRPREATPTLREIDPAMLLENIEPTSTVAVALPDADLLGTGRRRALIILAALVGLALAAFVIAGVLMADKKDAAPSHAPAPGASGDALDGPNIKVPPGRKR
jgi:hypothetical protein